MSFALAFAQTRNVSASKLTYFAFMVHPTCSHRPIPAFAPISNHARGKNSWAPAHKLDLCECAKTYKQAINASLSHPGSSGANGGKLDDALAPETPARSLQGRGCTPAKEPAFAS